MNAVQFVLLMKVTLEKILHATYIIRSNMSLKADSLKLEPLLILISSWDKMYKHICPVIYLLLHMFAMLGYAKSWCVGKS